MISFFLCLCVSFFFGKSCGLFEGVNPGGAFIPGYPKRITGKLCSSSWMTPAVDMTNVSSMKKTVGQFVMLTSIKQPPKKRCIGRINN